jgi:hypothetical protein
MPASLSYSARNVIALVILMFVGVSLHAGAADVQVVNISSGESFKGLSKVVALPDLVRAAEFMRRKYAAESVFDNGYNEYVEFVHAYAKTCKKFHIQDEQPAIFQQSVSDARDAFTTMVEAFASKKPRKMFSWLPLKKVRRSFSDDDFQECIVALNEPSSDEWRTRIFLPGVSCQWKEPDLSISQGSPSAPPKGVINSRSSDAPQRPSVDFPSYKKAFAVHGVVALVSALVWAGTSYKMAKSDNISVLKAFKGLVDQVLSNEVQPTKIQVLRLMTAAQFLYHVLGADSYFQGYANFETGRRYEFKHVS